MPRPKAGDHRHRTGPDAEGVVRRMAGAWPDHDIAASLTRLRLRPGAGNTWTASRVKSLRQRLRLVDYDETRATPMLTLNQAADRLGAGSWVLRRLITWGLLEATQVVSCAPWQLDPSVLDTDAIRNAAKWSAIAGGLGCWAICARSARARAGGPAPGGVARPWSAPRTP